jgi:hypothetical protein
MLWVDLEIRYKEMKKPIFQEEDRWDSLHTIEEGYGKNSGKFVARATKPGGKQIYFHVFDSLGDAQGYVKWRMTPQSERKAEDAERWGRVG